MAVTKILTRKGRLDIGINYVLNGDKTEERVLTTHLNCDPGREFRQMLDTKRAVGKEDGVQYYHIIQSFKPGEVTPEQALEIATEFAKEHLPGYETVIGVHVDKEHIHAHLVFNSVNADTGEKYHSNAKSYYRQIRAISDRLCREHGLSVLIQGEPSQAVSYIEWLRRSRGQPTFRSMLEEDLRSAMADANDLGHFFLLMEHMGYEISHGNRLGFRLRGQERFMIPGRKNALFTEDGIRATIQGNLAAIEVGRRPAVLPRPQYRPYQKHPKYTGFLALYVHYLYLLGKTGKRQYPPRMTPQLRQEVMRFEQYREQFSFLRDNNITTQADMATFTARTEEMLANLMKQRTVLNVRKKRHRALYTALADVSPLDLLFQAIEQVRPDSVAVRQYKVFKMAAGKTSKSILVSTAVRLAPFNLPQIKAITDHDDMDLYTLGEKKVALYAVIPDNDTTFNFLVSLLYAQAFQTLYYSADQTHHGALPRHVHFVLDEFAAMPLPGFTRELATMRSRNISASTIIQNMAQIKELYKDSWETIPGNSDTILYLGGNEASTHKYISEALGKATIDTRTHGQTKGRSGSYSTNFQMSGRELLTPDEVRGLDNRYAILFIRGARPVMDLKYELTQHPAIRHTVDGGGPPYIHKGKQAPAFTGTPLFQAFSAEELNESEENAA